MITIQSTTNASDSIDEILLEPTSNINSNSNSKHQHDITSNIGINKADDEIESTALKLKLQQQQQQRTHAIKQAALQTAKILSKEQNYQLLRNRPKEIYLEQLKEEEIQKEYKQEQYEQEQHEQSYYMYYEDANDTSSTVIGITYSSDINTYKRFIGSLRNTGFGGSIILGIEDLLPQNHAIVTYLHQNNVTIKSLHPIECTFESAKERQKCYRPYPHIKREWAFFPLARDYLSACESCLGPIIFAFPESTFFQKNPFGAGMPIVQRLHLYEHHPSVDVSTTSAGILMRACVDIDLKEEMEGDDPDIEPRGILSAATALGTRDDIIDYLGLVYSIIREWMLKSECHFHHSSGDMGMAIVNFLRVKERLPYKTRIMIHRTGIVNNVGFEGKNAIDAHVHLWKFRGLTTEAANLEPYEGGKGKGWIDTDYLVTDEDGDFIDVFLQKSAVIYGYESYGLPFLTWLNKGLNITEADETGIRTGNGNGNGEDKAQSQLQSQLQLGSVEDSVETGGGEPLLEQKQQAEPIIAVGEVTAQKKKDGYYIDANTQMELVKNKNKVQRKTEFHSADKIEVQNQNQASKEEMYYAEDEAGKNEKAENAKEDDEVVGSGDSVRNKDVPVTETHLKGKNSDADTDADAESEKEAEENVAASIQREPVDKKIEIDSE